MRAHLLQYRRATSSRMNFAELPGRRSHASPNSPLRGMSQVPHAISDRVQSVQQRFLRCSSSTVFVGQLYFVGRIHLVLRVWKSPLRKPVARERVQELQSFESRSQARVRHGGRNCASAKRSTGNAVSVVGSCGVRKQRKKGKRHVN